MKIVEHIKRFIFLPVMNVFDVLCIMMVSSLIVNHSWWWFLLYAITIPLSTLFQASIKDRKFT